jgi:hypothetical protein
MADVLATTAQAQLQKFSRRFFQKAALSSL